MTPQPLTDSQIRAAFVARSTGSPSPELAESINAATRRARQLRPLVVLPGGVAIQPQRLLWAAAISATSLALIGGLLVAGRQPDNLISVVPTETPTARPSGEPQASPSGPASLEPSVTVTPEPTATPEPTPPPPAVDPMLGVDSAAVTLVDDLRVRSAPTVGESSARLEPLLPAGVRLLVIDESVAADGYAWYYVKPFEAGYPSGWVAAGGREGGSWIGADQTPCPESPLDASELASLEPYGALACYGGQEIQVTGDIQCEIADVDNSIGGPTWLENDHYCRIELGDTSMQLYDSGIVIGYPLAPITWVATGHFADPQSSSCVWAVDPPAPDPAEIMATCRAQSVMTDVNSAP